ncbi:MAG: PEP-CTERM sorting domain-containing protein [Akkermansiaceae bacterium]|nr:PEP-CTERM sorting domain-containing protein [Akkermansiaceae bacterium]
MLLIISVFYDFEPTSILLSMLAGGMMLIRRKR